LGFVANALGEQARQREDYERAGRFYEQSIEIFRTLRSRAVLESPAQNLAWVWLHRGEYRKAKALFEAVLNSFREQGDQNSTAYTLTGFVGLFAKTGRPEQAARLLAAVEALFQHLRNGRPLEAQDQKELDRSSAVVRGQLDQAAFEKAYSEGRTMTLEQAVALAIGRPSDAVL
jgi:tetratricopeptide (TPR) repeat protein